MVQHSSILKFLQAEHKRYKLEVAELEQRLQRVRNQIISVEALISGCIQEEQMYQSPRNFALVSTQGMKEDDLDETKFQDHQEFLEHKRDDINQPSNNAMESANAAVEADILDISKLRTSKKPEGVPMLDEFQNYSVQDAILILMRCESEQHFDIDTVVRDLYGDELTSQQYKISKKNVASALSSGVQMGLWYKVLRTSGVYTLHYKKGVTSKPIGVR
jgi:hypothetical protein